MYETGRDSMNLHQLYLTENDCYKANRWITPKGVMVHSTGAENPNLKRYVGPDDGLLGVNQNNNDWNRSGVGACVHAFIGLLADGSVAAYQTLPWNMRGWHCGDDANSTHVSFEICEDDLTDPEYFAAVYREAVELTAYLCEMYGLDPMEDGVVICHAEGARLGIASNHGDVEHWFPRFEKSMDDFRIDVAEEMEDEIMTYEKWTEYMERYRQELREQPGSDWSQQARDWALANGVFQGDQNGNAMWQDFLTREQLAQVMERQHG